MGIRGHSKSTIFQHVHYLPVGIGQRLQWVLGRKKISKFGPYEGGQQVCLFCILIIRFYFKKIIV